MNIAEDYIQYIDRWLPVGYLRDTTALVLRAYRTSSDFCRERFSAEVAHDLVPHLRRATIEEEWLTLTDKYADSGVVAVSSPNRIASSFHTLVRFGRIVLTASKVDSPSDLPRDAVFRRTYARSPQLVLPGFALPRDTVVSDDADGLYVLLTHGPDPRNASCPAFVQLGVPTATCSGYLVRINLLHRYSDLISSETISVTPAAENVVVAQPEPTLRRQVRVRKEQKA